MAVARQGWWSKSNNSESTLNDNKDELLVFGYSCKLFRDEERAQFIDEGKHLVPWMGDGSLLIDRFDVRGYLHDLKQYNSPIDSDLSNLTTDEIAVEKLCEEERYLALKKDLEEEALHHEEELKRLQAALSEDTKYNEVQFNYDTTVVGPQAEVPEADGEEEKPFVVSEQLDLPSDVVKPLTVKQNAIIEKTALFIAKNGTQMEIVLKTKQSRNSQFGFLSFDDPLNPYYKHVVQCIKSGKYIPVIENENKDGSNDEDDDDEDYLHPSLFADKNSSNSDNNFTLYYPYSQLNDSAYSQLVDNLKDKVVQYQTNENSQSNSRVPTPEPPPAPEPVSEAPKIVDQVNIIPPEDMIDTINKMAAYVAKNGEGFEKTVLAKGDPRFNFLKPSHIYNKYYKQRCDNYIQHKNDPSIPITFEPKIKRTPKVSPVSFAIKSKDGDSSSIEKNILDLNVNSSATYSAYAPKKSENDMNNSSNVVEMKAIPQQERLKDKIAAAARERMVQITKEKMLQLERKRKAMLFLNMLKKSGVNLESSQNNPDETNSDEKSSLPTSAITSPIHSPKRSSHSNESRKVSRTHKSSSHGRLQRRRSRSRSRSRHSSNKSRRSRSRSRSYHRRNSSDREYSSSKSKKYSKRSRSRSHSKSRHSYKSKSRSKRRYSSSDSS